MEPQSNITTKVIGGIVAIGVIAGIASLAMKDKLPEVTEPISQDAETDTATTTTTDTTVKGATYKDGNYSADGMYNSPAGEEAVKVSIVVNNDIVIDATFSAHANSSQSTRYQAQFTEGFKAQVVGKKLADINVGKVSGSSLTGKGFMDALAKIKAQAQI